ncbi:flagellar filament capping protein FliD [Nocardioides sp. TRM66260-LWL]|uniref:flagellar filament capping protein FliD n=1 Tax=Nocardioides sp. TRM66260-LWL TaxID=2874478 RepID=UPI001CC53FBB|nr:flagellar filament capping protein FliD [Nocardioides sp. TRM66260-LWL]MBZ5736150.1 flagellar filament capping protein FliD [Nocardioides sp. TRM66260-LWL]
MGATISGLSSGLDTASIVNQLMQVEAQPQTQLKAKVTDQQRLLTALQGLNAKFASLTTAAEGLAKPGGLATLTATSSSTSITASATGSAAPTTLSVTVTSVARSHQLGFTEAHALTDRVTVPATQVTLDRFDGSPVVLETGDGTLQGLVNAINLTANDTGLRATTIKVADGSYKLMVTSVATGAASDFALTQTDGSPLLGGASVVAGSDAKIDLGSGIVATSSSNTFTDLLPGVAVTLKPDAAVGTTATISVARDADAVAKSVKSMVDSVNDILKTIDSGSAYNASTKTAGVLMGESTVRDLRDRLLDAVYPAGGAASLASVGIQVSRDGTLSFDATAFSQAYAADPAKVATAIDSTGGGFAERVRAMAKSASNTTDGVLTQAISGQNSELKRLNDSIADWDDRLALRRTSLERQFTALETALNQMQSQSNWLSGQLSKL